MCICLWPEFDCPDVTLCGRQDIKINIITISSCDLDLWVTQNFFFFEILVTYLPHAKFLPFIVSEKRPPLKNKPRNKQMDRWCRLTCASHMSQKFLFRNVQQADALALHTNINHSCLYCFIGLEDLKQNQSSDSEGAVQNLLHLKEPNARITIWSHVIEIVLFIYFITWFMNVKLKMMYLVSCLRIATHLLF